MKKLSSLFIALAVFCFIVLTSSCQGSGSAEAVEETTEAVEEAATEVMEETVDSAVVDTAVVEEVEAEEAH